MVISIRQSGEDYLETIYILSKRGGVRYIDIVNEMNVSKPSVCCAVGMLKNDGYITFTEEGRKTAECFCSTLP